jgi:hydrogenase expression/formation protein HypC
MCLAVPARVVTLDQDADLAMVEMGGVKKEVSLALVDGVAIGDYLLIHVGYALQRLSEAEAAQTLALFDALEDSRA